MSPGADAPHNAHILEKYCLNNPSGEILCLYFAHAQKYILILGRHLSKIIFTRGISKSSPVLRQVGRATGKHPGFEVIQRREQHKLARRRAVALLTAV
jgi:hypothetical protein